MDSEQVSVGSIVRTRDGALWRILMLGGTGGAIRYACMPLDRLMKEKRYLSRSDFDVVVRKD